MTNLENIKANNKLIKELISQGYRVAWNQETNETEIFAKVSYSDIKGTGNEQLTKQFEAIVSRYYESDGDRNNLETLKTDIQDLLGNITLYHPMNLPF
ncbi:TPA: hypothetical protein U1215_002012 [Streptococcus suis]|nr:hypothetical protein [Streptococcus suis]